MPKLMKKAIRLGRMDGRTDPNCRKASLLENSLPIRYLNIRGREQINSIWNWWKFGFLGVSIWKWVRIGGIKKEFDSEKIVCQNLCPFSMNNIKKRSTENWFPISSLISEVVRQTQLLQNLFSATSFILF